MDLDKAVREILDFIEVEDNPDKFVFFLEKKKNEFEPVANELFKRLADEIPFLFLCAFCEVFPQTFVANKNKIKEIVLKELDIDLFSAIIDMSRYVLPWKIIFPSKSEQIRILKRIFKELDFSEWDYIGSTWSDLFGLQKEFEYWIEYYWKKEG